MILHKMTVSGGLLVLPVTHGAEVRRVNVLADGLRVRYLDIEAAEGEPDYWVWTDISPWCGRELVLEVDGLGSQSPFFAALQQTDTVPDDASMYREALRPQFHFTSRRGWVNDPNGLVFLDGVYHLFYQHNPFGWKWGNMSWGHAVSHDLIHWQERQDALHPDALGTMYSGSAVVDHANTSGLQTGEHPPIVLFYTAAGQHAPEPVPFTQCLAYSLDSGDTWEKYPGNPVVPHIAGGNRDPKVVWHPVAGHWVMALYLEKRGDEQVFALLVSDNLLDWKQTQALCLPGSGECPDLFELAVDGEPGVSRWVFIGADGAHVIGEFDGRCFVPDGVPRMFYCGGAATRASGYAAQTYSDIPPADGRRILVPWLQTELPGMSFNQQLGAPVVLSLCRDAGDLRLCAQPVREIECLHGPEHAFVDVHLDAGGALVCPSAAELLHARATVTPGSATHVSIEVHGLRVEYDVTASMLECHGNSAPCPLVDGKLDMELLVDRASVEVFAGCGRVYMPVGVVLPELSRPLAVTAVGGAVIVESLRVWELKSAW